MNRRTLRKVFNILYYYTPKEEKGKLFIILSNLYVTRRISLEEYNITMDYCKKNIIKYEKSLSKSRVKKELLKLKYYFILKYVIK